MGGVTGLNYSCAHRVLDRMDLCREELSEWEDDLRILEWAAMAEINKDKE